MEKAKVYFTTDILPDGLVKIYDALGAKLKGKIGVKISTGEPGATILLPVSNAKMAAIFCLMQKKSA